jgi:hypothetical protein
MILLSMKNQIDFYCRGIKGNLAMSLPTLVNIYFPKIVGRGRGGGGGGGGGEGVSGRSTSKNVSGHHICHLIVCLTTVVRSIFP